MVRGRVKALLAEIGDRCPRLQQDAAGVAELAVENPFLARMASSQMVSHFQQQEQQEESDGDTTTDSDNITLAQPQ